MAKEVIYRCDVCGSVRQPSNKWFLGFDTSDGFSSIALRPFDEKEIRQYDGGYTGGTTKILCGENCVHKFISQNLSFLHGQRPAVVKNATETESLISNCDICTRVLVEGENVLCKDCSDKIGEDEEDEEERTRAYRRAAEEGVPL